MSETPNPIAWEDVPEDGPVFYRLKGSTERWFADVKRDGRLRGMPHLDLAGVEFARAEQQPGEQAARIAELEKQLRILDLSTPMEEDLSNRIDETLKYLAVQQGFTLTEIARILIDCQKRMAADWSMVGSERSQRMRAEESTHYANGVADLAIKHRDAAEAALTTLRQVLADNGIVYYDEQDGVAPGWRNEKLFALKAGIATLEQDMRDRANRLTAEAPEFYRQRIETFTGWAGRLAALRAGGQ